MLDVEPTFVLSTTYIADQMSLAIGVCFKQVPAIGTEHEGADRSHFRQVILCSEVLKKYSATLYGVQVMVSAFARVSRQKFEMKPQPRRTFELRMLPSRDATMRARIRDTRVRRHFPRRDVTDALHLYSVCTLSLLQTRCQTVSRRRLAWRSCQTNLRPTDCSITLSPTYCTTSCKSPEGRRHELDLYIGASCEKRRITRSPSCKTHISPMGGSHIPRRTAIDRKPHPSTIAAGCGRPPSVRPCLTLPSVP